MTSLSNPFDHVRTLHEGCFHRRTPTFSVRHNYVNPGGGILPYMSYMGMCRPIGWGFARFGLKTGIDFAHFVLESGMVFPGNYGSV